MFYNFSKQGISKSSKVKKKNNFTGEASHIVGSLKPHTLYIFLIISTVTYDNTTIYFSGEASHTVGAPDSPHMRVREAQTSKQNGSFNITNPLLENVRRVEEGGAIHQGPESQVAVQVGVAGVGGKAGRHSNGRGGSEGRAAQDRPLKTWLPW